jgi:hypothetical protein
VPVSPSLLLLLTAVPVSPSLQLLPTRKHPPFALVSTWQHSR